MITKLEINLRKRQERMYDFYYMVYGQMIKKRRLELNYTQEFVAKAICSDTYVSKAENSRVIIGDDQLFRIMEKLNMSRDEFGKPEELVHYLDQIITYFYHGDIEKYKKLVEKVEKYQFHVVVEIIRLGYNILINEKKKAVKISDQLIDYLNSMDDLAFNVYLCFSSIINVKLGKINLANYLITATFLLHLDYKKLINLYVYTKYIVYGKRYKFVKAEETFNELIPKLINTHNKRLVHEAMVWKALFKEYDNDGDEIEYIEEFIDGVDEDLVDELLLLKAYNTSEPEKYIKHMKNKESEKYLIALYLCSRKALKNNDKELSKKYQEDMKALHYKTGSDIDYNNLLNLEIKDNQSFYKEYLVNTCFKSAKSKENIFFMKKINDKVVKILKSRNRYKDALNYKERLEEEIREIQHGQ
ncbi:MAG: helix-turn-helix domain-containing protein [Candidatus Izemoplasmatales bacterium]